MTRKQEIENIIVGSLLNDRRKLRDCTILTDEMFDSPVNLELFHFCKRSTYQEPFAELATLFDMVDHNVFLTAMELSAFHDFDKMKDRHNLRANYAELFGRPDNYTNVRFSDYVTRFITLSYGRITA